MKFLVDLPLPPRTVTVLQSLGHEAIHAHTLGKTFAPDEELVHYVTENQMILVTTDLDFGAILAMKKTAIPTVILFRLSYATPDKIFEHLRFLLQQLTPQEFTHTIILVEDSRIRLRKLPIS